MSYLRQRAWHSSPSVEAMAHCHCKSDFRKCLCANSLRAVIIKQRSRSLKIDFSGLHPFSRCYNSLAYLPTGCTILNSSFGKMCACDHLSWFLRFCTQSEVHLAGLKCFKYVLRCTWLASFSSASTHSLSSAFHPQSEFCFLPTIQY